jgi:preprotein translocase subunit SecA
VEEVSRLEEEPTGNGDGRLSYEHESLQGADAIAAAGAGAGAAMAALSATASSTPVGRAGAAVATGQRVVSEQEKLGRNDPCWCGSGKKFKKCHGA